MKIEALAAAGALICAAPVVFGLIVAKWDRHWSRASRRGHLAGRGATELV